MGPISALYGTYIGPLSHSGNSEYLKIGPIWTLNDILVITVGWPYRFLETGSTWVPDGGSLSPL